MVHPYLKRRANPSLIKFPSPHPDHGPPDELYELLKKTKGVPLFQEQAMRLAIVAAKFSPDAPKGLRRPMAPSRHVGTIGSFQEKFISRMTARGYDPAF